MGKKTSQNCEEKPLSHKKIPGVASSGQQQKQETKSRRRKRKEDESVLKKTAKKEVSRQMKLARLVVEIPINFSLLPVDRFCIDACGKLLGSARENAPDSVLFLLGDKLSEKFGRSYKSFVTNLLKNIWLTVHLRRLQEDAGVFDEVMAEMHPLDQLKLWDAVNNTHTRSGEQRAMNVLVTAFRLQSNAVHDIITELVEKMVKDFAEVAPDDFAKIAHREDAMDHAMTLAVQGISLATQKINIL